jgi:hypothetical protein
MNQESRCCEPKTQEREVRAVGSERKATDSVVLILDPHVFVVIATIVWFMHHFQGYIEEEGTTTIFAESQVVEERKAQAHFNVQVIMGAIGVRFEKEHNTRDLYGATHSLITAVHF